MEGPPGENSFYSVTQQLNSNTPIGRLTLNVLLSFAQFEQEIISERTRDKQSAGRRKGQYAAFNRVPALAKKHSPAVPWSSRASDFYGSFSIEGKPDAPVDRPSARFRVVRPEYFRLI